MSHAHWELLSHLLDYGSFALLLVCCAIAVVAVARTPASPDKRSASPLV